MPSNSNKIAQAEKPKSKKEVEVAPEKRHRKPVLSYASYIYKVLKQVHPDTGLTGESLAALLNMVKILLKRFMTSINEVMGRSGGQTISSRTVDLGVRLTLPEELAKHASNECNKAVTKYNSVNKDSDARGSGQSRSFVAGLQFPVTRTENLMMKYATSARKSATAAVSLTAALEYVMAEVLELAGNVAKQSHRLRISPRHLMIAVRSDEELNRLFRNSVFAGGVMPCIPKELAAINRPSKTSSSKLSKKSAETEDEVPTKSSRKNSASDKKSAKKSSDSKKSKSPSKKTASRPKASKSPKVKAVRVRGK